MPTTTYQGREYSHPSIAVSLNGVNYPDIKSISDAIKVNRGKALGTRRASRARTVGEAEFTVSVTIYMSAYRRLIDQLGDGWMDSAFPMIVVLTEPNLPTVVDSFDVVGISSDDGESSEGTDALTRKLEFDCSMITKGGKRAIIAPSYV